MDLFGNKERELKNQLLRAATRYNDLVLKYNKLGKKWGDLVDTINQKGGQDFLDNATIGSKSQFSKSDIDSMIRLCHPDKHNNSTAATRITQMLLAMRG